jgi:hypothetical protein
MKRDLSNLVKRLLEVELLNLPAMLGQHKNTFPAVWHKSFLKQNCGVYLKTSCCCCCLNVCSHPHVGLCPISNSFRLVV